MALIGLENGFNHFICVGNPTKVSHIPDLNCRAIPLQTDHLVSS
ncbi:hypothetical protein HDE70_000273 [Pedobacter cryoconitis]|nr:hypothetical protein [Pedobacter cryoconitis]